MEEKYEFTEETCHVRGETLHRIRAIRDFGDVKKGELGGFIRDKFNLTHSGNAWVGDNAVVGNYARVWDNAVVRGNAQLRDYVLVCDNAVVGDNVRLSNSALAWSNAVIRGNARFGGNAVIENGVQITAKSKQICRAENTARFA